MPTPPAPQAAEAQPATVSLAALRGILDRLRTTSPQQEALVRAIWEAAVEAAEAPPDDGGDEGIDFSDLPDLGDDDAYWTGGRVGPVLSGPAVPVHVGDLPD